MPQEYAHALALSMRGITDTDVVNAHVHALIASLKSAGKLAALSAILREYERIVARRRTNRPALHVANEKQVTTATKALAAYKKLGVESEIVIDDTLIGGWRYIDGDTLIDSSHKAALLALYRRITNI